MMWNIKTRSILSLIVNIMIIIMEIIGFIYLVINFGIEAMITYTVQSNILALLSSSILVVCQIRFLTKEKNIPSFAKVFKHLSTTNLFLTIVVVITMLAPQSGDWYFMLVYFPNLFYHLLAPIFAILSFVFLEWEPMLNFKSTLIPITYTIIYAIVLIILNLTYVYHGPYFFLYVYEQPWYLSVIYTITIPGIAYLFDIILYNSNKCLCERFSKET